MANSELIAALLAGVAQPQPSADNPPATFATRQGQKPRPDIVKALTEWGSEALAKQPPNWFGQNVLANPDLQGALTAASFVGPKIPRANYGARPGGLMDRLGNVPQQTLRDVLPQDFPLNKREIRQSPYEGWSAETPGQTGNVSGMANTQDKTLRITGSELPPELRGQGVGMALYRRLIDEARSQGYVVHSDRTLSPSARKIYEALDERGYNVQRNPMAKEERDGSLKADEPVFTIRGMKSYSQ